jgi:hypothetical protein
MSTGEFKSYPGRAEMLALIGQRENQGAPQDQRETDADAYPMCIPQPSIES